MKRIIYYCLMIISIAFFNSCNKDSILKNSESEIALQNESHFISITDALKIADLQKSGITKGYNEYLEFINNGDLPEFYIINYPSAGFIIISADDRMTPVLAFSKDSHFPLCDSIVPFGVKNWLNSASAIVDSIRNTSMKQTNVAKHDWESVLSGRRTYFTELKNYNPSARNTDISTIVWEYGEDLDQDDCRGDGGVLAEYYIYVPQLTNTTWGQLDGYNESLPYAECESAYNMNGKYPLGCVTVAVGQVLVNNRYPAGFDWDAIYNNGYSYGTATNTFLRDLSQDLNIIYNCSGSTGYTFNAVTYLQSVGYNSATATSSFDGNMILSDLRYGYPVIFTGGTGSDSHMWVCDGIQSYYNVICFAAGGSYDTRNEINSNSQYLRMNWGWYGRYDGWYFMTNLCPGSHDYNDNNFVIHWIRP